MVILSDGEGRRCDAACYNAKGPDCECICEGVNHKAGQAGALANAHEMLDEWTEEGLEVTLEAPLSRVTLADLFRL